MLDYKTMFATLYENSKRKKPDPLTKIFNLTIFTLFALEFTIFSAKAGATLFVVIGALYAIVWGGAAVILLIKGCKGNRKRW